VLATEVDPENPNELADLFIRLLAEEHTARHQARPRLVRKFTQKIDDEQGGL
ncbi:uncharacterized protein METZ01_LOCUS375962, partial [marine metagenome]